MDAGEVIRAARLEEGMSQASLARRLGITQPAVARLERAGDSITAATLRRTLGALGRSLELRAAARPSSVDDTLLREQLRLTPAERIARFEDTYNGVREIARASRAARGVA